MRLTTNEKLVQQRSTWARYLTFAGMGLLLGSLVLSFMTDYIMLAYGALFAGFVVAMVGSNLANKWVKPPRPDQVLEKSLKGFDNKHHLYNYLLPAEHVLVTPGGALVLKAKYHDGEITCKNGKWNRPWKWTRLFGALAQEPLGNPIAEMQYEIGKLQQILADKIENAATIPVEGYVVFTDPRAHLSIDDSSLPVVLAGDLKEALRKGKRAQPLPSSVLENLDQVLNEYANAKTTKQR
jgi:hypothetical protein